SQARIAGVPARTADLPHLRTGGDRQLALAPQLRPGESRQLPDRQPPADGSAAPRELHGAPVRAPVPPVVRSAVGPLGPGRRRRRPDRPAGRRRRCARDARANLRKLQAGTSAESIAVARAAVSRAQDAAKFAQAKLARSKQLFEGQALSPQEFEAAQEQAATAQNDLAEARSQLRVFVRGTRPEEIEAARAAIDRLEAQQHLLETQMGLLDVVSPATGVVATPARELKEMQGQFVGKGALIAKVYAV